MLKTLNNDIAAQKLEAQKAITEYQLVYEWLTLGLFPAIAAVLCAERVRRDLGNIGGCVIKHYTNPCVGSNRSGGTSSFPYDSRKDRDKLLSTHMFPQHTAMGIFLYVDSAGLLPPMQFAVGVRLWKPELLHDVLHPRSHDIWSKENNGLALMVGAINKHADHHSSYTEKATLVHSFPETPWVATTTWAKDRVEAAYEFWLENNNTEQDYELFREKTP